MRLENIWRRIAGVLFAAMVVLGIGFAARAEEPIEVARKIAATMSAAVASGDIDAYAGLYAADALLLPPNGAVIVGRDNIRTVLAANQRTGANKLEFGQFHVNGDESQATLLWTWILTITPPDKPPIQTRGRSVVDLRLLGDRWQIAVDMFQIY